MSRWAPERLGRRDGRSPWHPYLAVPADWSVRFAAGVGPFPTHVRWRRPDQVDVTWRSRAHRKHPVRRVQRWWLAPTELGWWIGVLFAVGSSCFLVASLPPVAGRWSAEAVGRTYVVGSIFFTAAAAAQYVQTQSAGIDPGAPARRRFGHRAAAEPRRIDWWASATQLVGTVLFNRNTWFGMVDGLSPGQQDRLVWAPDVLGSVCFLVASGLAWAEVCDGWWSWRPRDVAWWIAGANLVGSIAFGASAVAAFVRPSTGDELLAGLAQGGTLVGAVCFLVGAVLLLPELQAAPTQTGEAAPPIAPGS